MNNRLCFILLPGLLPAKLVMADEPGVQRKCERIGNKLGSVRVNDIAWQPDLTTTSSLSARRAPIL